MIGRLAPSPTGAQHLGNARTFLIAWLLARRTNSPIWLRIEDLETPRVKDWATQQAIEDLLWLGLDWDEILLDGERKNYILQTDRLQHYEQILIDLQQRELAYPCTCTRSQIESISAAPHEFNLDGPVYPGTCSSNSVRDAIGLVEKQIPFAWRFRIPSRKMEFVDQFAGLQKIENPHRQLGDFIVARASGAIAYQLAVVVDDHDMKVEQVVRGDDLLISTFRQLVLYDALNWTAPQFCHLPLVVGLDGRRLAKRHGDTRLSTYRDAGIKAESIIGMLAYRSGLIDQFHPISAKELLAIDPLSKLSRNPLVVDSTRLFVAESRAT
jgi:glutamyl-tRNA synthetase